MEDKSERHRLINEFAKEMVGSADENVGGILELMERLSLGKPYISKKERKLIQTFLSIVIDCIAMYSKQMTDMNSMWNSQIEIEKKLRDIIGYQTRVIESLQRRLDE